MELYCVKEKRNTPNVQGSEKVVITEKNNRRLLKAKCASCGITKTSFMLENVKGSGIDIHAAIGKFPKPRKGWTLPGHNYTGPYNPLVKQVKYNPETGEILEIYQHQQARQMQLLCNMKLIMMFVPTVKKNTVKISKNAKTKQIKKW